MNETAVLSRFAANLRYDDLPAATVRHAREALLDWAGVAIAGADEPAARILRETALAGAGGSACWVAGAGYATDSAPLAALANGAASHALDFDDLHNPSVIHLGTVVIPAAVAAAQAVGASGRDLITALVAGFEVGGRVGESIIPESYYYWHTTGTAGVFGAAAAAGVIYGLDADRMCHCLGTAGTQAAGLWEFLTDGAMSKLVHAGKAAFEGVLSAALSARGFSGATRIIEGEKGFCRALSPNPHEACLTRGLGKAPYAVDNNSYKPSPCCRHAHAAIAAALALRDESRDIVAVTLHANSLTRTLIDNPAPRTAYGCKFNVRYCLACALHDGNVTLEHFTDTARNDAALRALMEKIDVVPAPDLDALRAADNAKMPACLVIRYTDGTTAETAVLYPPGDPAAPLTPAQRTDKYRRLAEPRIGPAAARSLHDCIRRTETYDDWPAAWRTLWSAPPHEPHTRNKKRSPEGLRF